ncbi:MAG: L-aspartate oxidase [bacterium]
MRRSNTAKDRAPSTRASRATDVETDVLVIGSGLAGLYLSLLLAPVARVALVTKKKGRESNTNYAQGGIASVLDPTDSYASHIADTLRAGDGLCDERVVKLVVSEGPRLIGALVDLGVPFTAEKGRLALGKEGGHSKRRIVHALDQTGRAVEETLMDLARRHRNIRVYEDHLAVDLVPLSKLSVRHGRGNPVVGAYVYDTRAQRVDVFRSKATVLATGGTGKVYLYTTNPDIATGDGIAMAFRAGAAVGNLEFVQFHPTCLYHPRAKSFLISEAVRGEGAVLTTLDGKPFMQRYHRLRSLAPRDIVARAIDAEMKRRGEKHVLLDLSPIGAARIRRRFPHIYERCLSYGIDASREAIPVVPAAHYMCGGVRTDIDGRTSLARLYACGEVALTGLHGANRLASNSLLEALVFAERTANAVAASLAEPAEPPPIPAWAPGAARASREGVTLDHAWDAVRRLMWDYVGIVRTSERLVLASRRMRALRREIEEHYWRYHLSPDLIELRNIALVGELIIRCAIARRESRGLHYNLDFPRKDDANWRRDTILRRKRTGGRNRAAGANAKRGIDEAGP